MAAQARKVIASCTAAVVAGMDPMLLAKQSRQAQLDLGAAEAVMGAHVDQGPALDMDALRRMLAAAEAWPTLLAAATPDERRRLYAAAGLRLEYWRAVDGSELVRGTVAWSQLRVGEGT